MVGDGRAGGWAGIIISLLATVEIRDIVESRASIIAIAIADRM